MNIKTMSIFRKLDSQTDWEKPADLNRIELLTDISVVVDEIARKVNSRYIVNSTIQDASFCAEVSLGHRTTEMGHFEQRLIFSNFGKMVTINDPDIPISLLDKTKEILQLNGFNYIEFVDTQIEYDGLIQDKDRIKTWFTRFFDYL